MSLTFAPSHRFAHTLCLWISTITNECFEETSLKSYLGYQYCFHVEFSRNIFPGQFNRKFFTVERISLISIEGSYKCDGEFKKVQKWTRKESGKSSMTPHESKISHIWMFTCCSIIHRVYISILCSSCILWLCSWVTFRFGFDKILLKDFRPTKSTDTPQKKLLRLHLSKIQ